MKPAHIVLLLFCGCYSPKLGSPGFFCHSDDNPACPDGQQCINGRCAPPGTKVPLDGDMGAGDNGDMAHSQNGSHDMATGNTGSHDLAQSQQPLDFGTVTGMTGCAGEVQCLNNCAANDMTCVTNCQNNATPTGNNLLNQLISCIQSACPSTLSSDPCYNSSSTACTNCVNGAQMTGGQCESQLNACSANTP